jgi:hypothetical protein
MFIDYYQNGIVFDRPFDKYTFRTLGPRATDSEREVWFRDIIESSRSVGTTALDLGEPPETSRAYFVDAARAAFHAIPHCPDLIDQERALEAFFSFGIARDRKAARAFAETYAKTASGIAPLGGSRIRWGVTNVLAAHATGGPLGDAADRLDSIPLDKLPKAGPMLEALRKLTLHAATASSPNPIPLLDKLIAETRKIWRYEVSGTLEAYLCTWGLAVACIARDRGWKVPDDDSRPSAPLSLLRLPPTHIDLTDQTFRPPSTEMKKRVLTARKSMLAVLHPQR